MTDNGKPPNFEPDNQDSAAMTLVRSGLQLLKIENETMQQIAQLRPRDEGRVLTGALAELALVPDEADKNYYVIPHKNHERGCQDRKNCQCPSKNVEGPSVRAARTLVRRWGNCSVSSGRVISEDDSSILLQAVFMDFETGYRKDRVFPVSKWGVSYRGQPARKLADEVLARAMAIGASKVERNVILEALPNYLVSAFYNKAREAAATKGRAGTWNSKRQGQIIAAAFAKVGVTAEMLALYLCHDLSTITESEYADLVGIGNAIRDGEADVSDVFKVEAPQPTTQETSPADILDDATASITERTEPDARPFPQDVQKTDPNDLFDDAEPQPAAEVQLKRSELLKDVFMAQRKIGAVKFKKILKDLGTDSVEFMMLPQAKLQAILDASLRSL